MENHDKHSHAHVNNHSMNNDSTIYDENHYDKHKGHHDKMFKRKFIISIFFTIPLVLLSSTFQDIFGYSLTFKGDEYIQLILGTILYFYCGAPFLRGAKEEVKHKSIGMMSLVTIAITVAYLYSVLVVFGFPGMDFFWELATLISIMLLGHWLEMKSVSSASKAVESLAQLLPKKAMLVLKEIKKEILISEIKKDDILMIKSNEKIPADGVIIEGESYINESMLTGESKPVLRKVSDKVIGGAINGQSTLFIQVTESGDDSYISTIMKIVKDAQDSKSKMQNLADKAAKWLTYLAIIAGITTLSVWLLLGKSFDFSLMMMVGVVVIACPHALGLAVPLVASNSISRVAQNGVLIKNRTAFENSKKATTVIFDKTGTLTVGNFSIVNIKSYSSLSNNEILQYVASIEQFSEHPIAQAITNGFKQSKMEFLNVKDYESLTAQGVIGKINNKVVEVLSKKAVIKRGIQLSEEENQSTEVYLIIDEVLFGKIELADQIRDTAYDAVKNLREQGIKVYMATGDNDTVAAYVSEKLGLNGYFADLSPTDKLEIIDNLHAENEYIVMVGDGVNDAPALAKADISVAIGSGTAVANETADIVLINNNPLDVYKMLNWGKITRNKMVQNLLWATIYNVIAIPIAAGILYPTFLLPPAVGAGIMSISTIIVAINAQLLLNKIK